MLLNVPFVYLKNNLFYRSEGFGFYKLVRSTVFFLFICDKVVVLKPQRCLRVKTTETLYLSFSSDFDLDRR